MEMKALRYLTAALVISVVVGSATAEDLNPATWRTDPPGQDATTLQAWEFGTNDPNAAPDVLYNPFGSAALSVVGGQWLADYEGRTGVWQLGAPDGLSVFIPNNPIENEYKHIWLQVTFFEPDGFDPMILTDPLYGSLETAQSTDLGNGWWHRTYSIQIFPNPEAETVALFSPGCTMSFDELVIDTICTPEPAALMLLTLGGVFVRRR
jgi:hypothetical protein